MTLSKININLWLAYAYQADSSHFTFAQIHFAQKFLQFWVTLSFPYLPPLDFHSPFESQPPTMVGSLSAGNFDQIGKRPPSSPQRMAGTSL